DTPLSNLLSQSFGEDKIITVTDPQSLKKLLEISDSFKSEKQVSVAQELSAKIINAGLGDPAKAETHSPVINANLDSIVKALQSGSGGQLFHVLNNMLTMQAKRQTVVYEKLWEMHNKQDPRVLNIIPARTQRSANSGNFEISIEQEAQVKA